MGYWTLFVLILVIGLSHGRPLYNETEVSRDLYWIRIPVYEILQGNLTHYPYTKEIGMEECLTKCEDSPTSLIVSIFLIISVLFNIILGIGVYANTYLRKIFRI